MTAPRAKAPLLAALAAAVALSAGCLLEERTPTGRVDLYWTFSSPSLGAIGDVVNDGARTICSAAAVHDLRVSLWRAAPPGEALPPWTKPCIGPGDVPGAAFDQLEPGSWGYLLEARRGGVTVYELTGELEILEGGRTVEEARLPPIPGNWDVAVDYATTGCAADDRLRFELVDVDAAKVAFATDDPAVNPAVVVPCTHALPFTIPSVPAGRYQLSEVVQVDAAGTTEKRYSTCRPAWTQTATGSSTVTVDVTSATPTPDLCP